MNLKGTIKKLDELSSKATQGEWKVFNEYECWIVVKVGDNEKEPIFDDGSSAGEYSPRCSEIDRDYIIALHNSYETLRKAALAGEELYESIVYQTGDWKQARLKALTAYRSAIEER